MKRTKILIIILAAVLVLGISACNRSRSTPPPNDNTSSQDFEIPGTEQAIEQLSQYATQTAMAMTGETEEPDDQVATDEPTEPGESAATPVPDDDTSEPTTAPTAVPTQQPAGEVQDSYPVPDTYVLQKGEFPYCLARRFDIDPNTLLSANGLSRASQVYPGMELTIPGNGGSFPDERALKNHPTTHTVVAGETIYTIACTYGDVDPRAIIDANNLEEPYGISAGDQLHIP